MDEIRKQLAVFRHYWKTSRFFRELVLFLVSIVTGGFLALFYLIHSLFSDSDWFMSLAVYYGLLTLIRIYLCNRKWVVHNTPHPKEKDEISRKSMETTGVLLVLMNVALSVMIGEMVFFGHSKSYWVWMRYYIIIYTCFRIWNAFKTAYHGRKRHRINRMIHVINMMDALVGMFALTATIIDTYAHDSFLRTPVLAVSGLLIIGILIMISDHMMMASIRDEENSK
ncbi:MAG: hypothetical protein IJM63_12955 [Solobacterium sp.]|nr:hypothetical protein [Solobacterium sp.]MBQ9825401.1 hypothetical protein [Solobacterium sp.]